MKMKRFKVLGVNDDKSFCMCCGRQGLQQVVWIEDTETGKVSHFGTSCATNPAKCFNLKKEIRDEIASFKNREASIWRAAAGLYRASGGEWINYEDPKYGPMATAADRGWYETCREAVKLQIAA